MAPFYEFFSCSVDNQEFQGTALAARHHPRPTKFEDKSLIYTGILGKFCGTSFVEYYSRMSYSVADVVTEPAMIQPRLHVD
jgi:hypothetical protein